MFLGLDSDHRKADANLVGLKDSQSRACGDVHTWDFAGPHGRMFSALVLLLCFPYLECVTVFYRGKVQWVERVENRGLRTMAETVFKL